MNRLNVRGFSAPATANAAPALPPPCDICRGRGFIPHSAEWGSAEEVSAALDSGAGCLCTCERGRWWHNWFRQLSEPYLDRNGNSIPSGFTMPEAGVPDFARAA